MLKFLDSVEINEFQKETPEFHKKLIKEFVELDEKVYNLKKVITGENPIKMTIPEASILDDQFRNMKSYLYNLHSRCKLYKLVTYVIPKYESDSDINCCDE